MRNKRFLLTNREFFERAVKNKDYRPYTLKLLVQTMFEQDKEWLGENYPEHILRFVGELNETN